MYYEIFHEGNLILRDTELLSDLSWDNELMYTPSLSLTFPATMLEYIKPFYEIKVYVNDKIFWGLIVDIDINKEEETIDVELDHIVREWTFREISVNNAIKEKNINIIFQKEPEKTTKSKKDKDTNKKDMDKLEEVDPEVKDQLINIYEDDNFAYPGWNITFSKKAQSEKIDYVYSRQNKLDALTKTCELTEDLFWRVGFTGEKLIEVSEFGEVKPYIISLKPSGKTNIRMIVEPTIDYDFDDIINVATIYSAKSDSGMSSLTMREIYEDDSLQDDMFPVIILRPNVNNERDYSKYIRQPKAIAPNNEYEYAVLDLEGIAQAGGYLVESSFAFNDISPFAVDKENGKTTKITDKDRVLAATQAYKSAIRKLKAARLKYTLEIQTEELPTDVNVGDKVRLLYDNEMFILESCSNYMKKILSYDEYFYITKISYEIDETGGEVDTITLAKELELDREELNEK